MKIKKGILLLLVCALFLTGCGGSGTMKDPEEVLAGYTFTDIWKNSKFNYTQDAEWISSHIRVVQLELMRDRYSLSTAGSAFLEREEFAGGLYASLVEEFFEDIEEREEYSGMSEAELRELAGSFLAFLEDLSESEAWRTRVRSGRQTLETGHEAESAWKFSETYTAESLKEQLLEGLVPSAGGDRVFGIEAIREEAIASLRSADEDARPTAFFFADVIVTAEYQALQGLYEEGTAEYAFLGEELEKLKVMTYDAPVLAGTYTAPEKEEQKKLYIRFADESATSTTESGTFSEEADAPVEEAGE